MEPQVLEARIKKKWQENHISSIVSIDGKPAMEKGENYCSVIMRYRLEIVYCSGEKSVKYFIIKKLPPSEAQEKFLQEFSFFRNEIHVSKAFYHKIIIKTYLHTNKIITMIFLCNSLMHFILYTQQFLT